MVSVIRDTVIATVVLPAAVSLNPNHHQQIEVVSDADARLMDWMRAVIGSPRYAAPFAS